MVFNKYYTSRYNPFDFLLDDFFVRFYLRVLFHNPAVVFNRIKKKKMSATKLFWIDAVKAICMFSVYLLHSQQYYGLGNTDYGYALMPFYVNAFFFVSGYLFFKKYLAFDLTNIKSWGG